VSAYVVEKKTMDRVVATVYAFPSRDVYYPELDGDPDQIGSKLWNLNVRAVAERYGEKYDLCKQLRLYKYRAPGYIDRLQQIKSIRCLLYQLSEGSVPKTKLYQELEDLCNQLMLAYISTLPEYDQAEWA
jgi:hypothetical protein